jgi:hypothetical protein
VRREVLGLYGRAEGAVSWPTALGFVILPLTQP